MGGRLPGAAVWGVPGLLHPSADQSRMLTVGAASSGGQTEQGVPPNADTADFA